MQPATKGNRPTWKGKGGDGKGSKGKGQGRGKGRGSGKGGGRGKGPGDWTKGKGKGKGKGYVAPGDRVDRDGNIMRQGKGKPKPKGGRIPHNKLAAAPKFRTGGNAELMSDPSEVTMTRHSGAVKQQVTASEKIEYVTGGHAFAEMGIPVGRFTNMQVASIPPYSILMKSINGLPPLIKSPEEPEGIEPTGNLTLAGESGGGADWGSDDEGEDETFYFYSQDALKDSKKGNYDALAGLYRIKCKTVAERVEFNALQQLADVKTQLDEGLSWKMIRGRSYWGAAHLSFLDKMSLYKKRSKVLALVTAMVSKGGKRGLLHRIVLMAFQAVHLVHVELQKTVSGMDLTLDEIKDAKEMIKNVLRLDFRSGVAEVYLSQLRNEDEIATKVDDITRRGQDLMSTNQIADTWRGVPGFALLYNRFNTDASRVMMTALHRDTVNFTTTFLPEVLAEVRYTQDATVHPAILMSVKPTIFRMRIDIPRNDNDRYFIDHVGNNEGEKPLGVPVAVMVKSTIITGHKSVHIHFTVNGYASSQQRESKNAETHITFNYDDKPITFEVMDGPRWNVMSAHKQVIHNDVVADMTGKSLTVSQAIGRAWSLEILYLDDEPDGADGAYVGVLTPFILLGSGVSPANFILFGGSRKSDTESRMETERETIARRSASVISDGMNALDHGTSNIIGILVSVMYSFATGYDAETTPGFGENGGNVMDTIKMILLQHESTAPTFRNIDVISWGTSKIEHRMRLVLASTNGLAEKFLMYIASVELYDLFRSVFMPGSSDVRVEANRYFEEITSDGLDGLRASIERVLIRRVLLTKTLVEGSGYLTNLLLRLYGINAREEAFLGSVTMNAASLNVLTQSMTVLEQRNKPKSGVNPPAMFSETLDSLSAIQAALAINLTMSEVVTPAVKVADEPGPQVVKSGFEQYKEKVIIVIEGEMLNYMNETGDKGLVISTDRVEQFTGAVSLVRQAKTEEEVGKIIDQLGSQEIEVPEETVDMGKTYDPVVNILGTAEGEVDLLLDKLAQDNLGPTDVMEFLKGSQSVDEDNPDQELPALDAYGFGWDWLEHDPTDTALKAWGFNTVKTIPKDARISYYASDEAYKPDSERHGGIFDGALDGPTAPKYKYIHHLSSKVTAVYFCKELQHLVVAYKGTSSASDLVTDIFIASGKQDKAPLYKQDLIDFASIIKELKPSKTTLTGHSLGGSRAEHTLQNFSSFVNEVHAFNAGRGKDKAAVIKYANCHGSKDWCKKITFHQVVGDVLSALNAVLGGKKIWYKKQSYFNLASNHYLTAFPALPKIMYLTR